MTTRVRLTYEDYAALPDDDLVFVEAARRSPHCWIVDPEARTIEAHGFAQGVYREVGRLAGATPASLLPFPGLPLDPRETWPEPLPARQ